MSLYVIVIVLRAHTCTCIIPDQESIIREERVLLLTLASISVRIVYVHVYIHNINASVACLNN